MHKSTKSIAATFVLYSTLMSPIFYSIPARADAVCPAGPRCDQAVGETPCVINTTSARWCWEQTGTATQWEVEVAYDSQPWAYYTTTTNELRLPPPDREARARMRLRARTLVPSVSQWSPWGRWAFGVPVGYDPDWDQDGFLFPSDLNAWMHMAEGSEWPR